MNRAQFLEISGIEATTLDVWIEQQWIVAETADYSEIDIARVRFIRELQHDMGANDAGIDIILHLVDQLHSMRQAMETVRAELNSAAVSKSKKRKPS